MKKILVLLTVSVLVAQNPVPWTIVGAGGGGSTPSTPPTNYQPTINLTVSPYYASGFLAQAYTTDGIGVGATTDINLNTVSGFVVGQYMTCLFGSAPSGKQTVRITAIASLDVTFTPAVLASVTPGLTTNCWSEGATRGTSDGSTTVVVGSSASYSANQGVYLAGAATGPIDYIGTVVSITDTTHIVVTPAPTVNVTNALFQHDDTAALQLVITNNKQIGADVYFPGPEYGQYGNYNLNGPYQDAGALATHCNCVIKAPSIPVAQKNTDQVVYNFHGGKIPIHGWVPSATTIQTLKTGGGNLFAATPEATASFGAFTQVHFQFERLRFATYVDPDVNILYGKNLIGLSTRFVAVIGEGTDGASTHAASTGIVMPTTTNYANTDLFDTYVNNFYTGIILAEHTRAFFTDVTGNHNGYEAQASPTSHAIYGSYMMAERNTVGLYCNATCGQVYINVLSVEVNGADIVGSNILKGYVGVQASLTANPVLTGVTGISIWDIKNSQWIGKGPVYVISAAASLIGSSQNTSNTGYTAWNLYDDAGVLQANFGWGNSGSAVPSKFFFQSVVTGKIDFLASKVQVNTILTVGTLGTCNAGAEGTYAAVSDALAPAFLATVVGGGAIHAPVYCNGTNWVAN